MGEVHDASTQAGRTSCATFWLSGIAEALATEGLDAAGFFREAGLSVEALADCEARFSSEDVSRLWEVAIARSGNPAVGLAGARHPRPGHFGVVAYALMSAPNLLGILQRVVRYTGVVSDAAEATLQPRGHGHRLILRLHQGAGVVPDLRYAFDLLMLLSFCRWATARSLAATTVELSHRGGTARQAIEAAFECPVRFGTAENAMIFSQDDIRQALPTSHDRLLAVHDQMATEQLERILGPAIVTRVRAAVSRRLPDGAPTLSAIAGTLGTSVRTLSRRLAEAGVSFQQLVDDTRHELAETYLARAELSLADVAYLLGFKDQGSFFRAARRWFDMTPRQFRQRALQAG